MTLTTPVSNSENRGAASALAAPRSLMLIAAVFVLFAIAMVWISAYQIMAAAEPGWAVTMNAVAALLALAALTLLIPVARAAMHSKSASASIASGDAVAARASISRARVQSWTAISVAIPFLVVAAFVGVLTANDHAVQRVFFDPEFMWKTLGDIGIAFGRNIGIALAAEAIVLVLGLLLAIGRLLPGPAARPVRFLSIAYVDGFRAIPAIIIIYLIGFGLPLSEIPVLSEIGPFWSAVLALGLTHAAYAAEVYRSGIESIHHSQTSAARSLGLSYPKTLRFVIVPQAVRRVLPPMLNSFIGLQKDTALVMVIGVVEAFTQATTYASRYFNLSSVTVVAILFILITIPQTRLVDQLISRDRRRSSAKG